MFLSGNVITMPMSRAPVYREFNWQSGLGEDWAFQRKRTTFKIKVPPGKIEHRIIDYRLITML